MGRLRVDMLTGYRASAALEDTVYFVVRVAHSICSIQ